MEFEIWSEGSKIGKEFEIWSEGYAITGNNGQAYMHGTIKAKNFKDACTRFFNKKELRDDLYDPKDLTYWGCRLYDNETDARKAFG